MQIHTITTGDTLWRLSQLYNVSVEQITAANEIPNPNQLVNGQTVVIPIEGSYHFVKFGETLFQISRRYNISVQELIRINQIVNPERLPVGLRLYIPQTVKPVIETAAYIDPRSSGAASVGIVDKIGENLTYLNIFTYAANRDGSLTPVNDTALIAASYRQRAAPMMVLSNFEDGTFSTSLATDILSSDAVQNLLLDNALAVVKEKGYFGIDVDFEYLGAENRQPFNNFMRKAAERLHAENYILTAALAPKTSSDQRGTLYEGHDYQALGQITDFLFLMTYEWGWSGGPPMAVSPINQVKSVLEYAVTVIPRDKIMMGIPLYGYDWTLPYVRGGAWARVVSPQQAIMLALEKRAAIQYNTVSQAPYFFYYDEQGRQHEVWFEDARSVQAKFNLVKELKIRGLFYWVLGRDFPQNWLLLQDNFTVNKLIN